MQRRACDKEFRHVVGKFHVEGLRIEGLGLRAQGLGLKLSLRSRISNSKAPEARKWVHLKRVLTIFLATGFLNVFMKRVVGLECVKRKKIVQSTVTREDV